MRKRRPRSANADGRPLRPARASEAGFTVIELLVALLVIGILAAIAVPSFFNQRDKAKDAKAKAQLVTARGAMEAYSLDSSGVYAGATPAALEAIEGALTEIPLTVVSANQETYKLQVTSDTGRIYTLERLAGGLEAHTCTPAGEGGCHLDGTW